MKNTLSIVAVCCALFTSVSAQDRFSAPVSADVLAGWVRADGTRIAALRLKLQPGWKTYWRAPGDAGIPPIFNWARSRNLESVAITWPTPKVFDQNGMRSVGYEGTLIIPLRIEPKQEGTPVRLKADMELGVCSDVCIPHTVTFEKNLDTTTSTPTPAIAAAIAHQPYSASEAGVRAAVCIVNPTSDGLQIEARVTMPPAGDSEYMVIEPGPGDIWVSEAKTKRYGDEVVAVSEMVNVTGGPISLDRSAIRLTVLGSKFAVDIHGCTSG